MKANEAPEKIWMDLEWIPHFDCKDCITEDSIEYTRTDAFIEMAAECLENINLSDYIVVYHSNPTTFININQEKLIENFKKAMKGE